MTDLAYCVLSVAFFVVCWALVLLFDRLSRADS